MGHIRDDFGPFSIETKGDGFIIHSQYGYRPARCRADQLMPGAQFFFATDSERIVFKVLGITETKVRAAAADDTTEVARDGTEVVPCEPDGTPLDVENDEAAGKFGAHWREAPHPTFLRQDLDNLIACLCDLRGDRTD